MVAETTDARKAKLQEVFANKLDGAIQAYGPEANRIERFTESIDDSIVQLGPQSPLRFDAMDIGGRYGIGLSGLSLREQADALGFTHHSLGQMASKLDVPAKFVRDLASAREDDWGPALAARILNDHTAHNAQSRILIRTIDGEARGVLSDAYRRLDSSAIARKFLQGAQNAGAQLWNANLDDTQVSMEVLLPHIFTIPTIHNGTAFVGYGARYTNSDFGDGAQVISLIELRAECTNLHVFKNAIRQIHLGKRLPDDIELSQRTYDLDSDAQASLVGDAMSSLLSVESIQKRIESTQEAASTVIDAEAAIKRLPKLGLSKTEAESVEKTLVRNQIDQVPSGPVTPYKMASAISFVGQLAEKPRRRRDLEELAGTFLGK
jgi:hypothetical protein